MRLAYLVSRFPKVSETFVVRELDAVASEPDLDAELLSLYPVGETHVVHPLSASWMPRLHRGSFSAGLAAVPYWLLRSPGRLLSTVATVARAYARRPEALGRALVTLLPALAHARRLRALGVEHVHAHFASFPATGAWVIWRLTGIPYSFTAHAHDIFVHQLFLARKLQDARFAVTISEYNRRFLAQVGDVSALHVLRAGIDPDRYPYRQRDLAPGRPLKAVTVAALQEKKGHSVLLEALAGEPRLEHVSFELIGDGELREELEAQIRRLGLADRVTLTGALPQDEVTRRLEAADFFVLPSIVARSGQMEGVPVALMEAMACGLPVVATRLSGVPELVRDGETGLLAEPSSADSLRAALLALVDDPPAAVTRAREGRALVEAEFDGRESARALAELYRDGA